MFAYEWDDQPLKQKHGFPLRIYIPDRYGMKQPKWIKSIEFVDAWAEGYWVRRGWSVEAIVNYHLGRRHRRHRFHPQRRRRLSSCRSAASPTPAPR